MLSKFSRLGLALAATLLIGCDGHGDMDDRFDAFGATSVGDDATSAGDAESDDPPGEAPGEDETEADGDPDDGGTAGSPAVEDSSTASSDDTSAADPSSTGSGDDETEPPEEPEEPEEPAEEPTGDTGGDEEDTGGDTGWDVDDWTADMVPRCVEDATAYGERVYELCVQDDVTPCEEQGCFHWANYQFYVEMHQCLWEQPQDLVVLVRACTQLEYNIDMSMLCDVEDATAEDRREWIRHPYMTWPSTGMPSEAPSTWPAAWPEVWPKGDPTLWPTEVLHCPRPLWQD